MSSSKLPTPTSSTDLKKQRQSPKTNQMVAPTFPMITITRANNQIEEKVKNNNLEISAKKNESASRPQLKQQGMVATNSPQVLKSQPSSYISSLEDMESQTPGRAQKPLRSGPPLSQQSLSNKDSRSSGSSLFNFKKAPKSLKQGSEGKEEKELPSYTKSSLFINSEGGHKPQNKFNFKNMEVSRIRTQLDENLEKPNFWKKKRRFEKSFTTKQPEFTNKAGKRGTYLSTPRQPKLSKSRLGLSSRPQGDKSSEPESEIKEMVLTRPGMGLGSLDQLQGTQPTRKVVTEAAEDEKEAKLNNACENLFKNVIDSEYVQNPKKIEIQLVGKNQYKIIIDGQPAPSMEEGGNQLPMKSFTKTTMANPMAPSPIKHSKTKFENIDAGMLKKSKKSHRKNYWRTKRMGGRAERERGQMRQPTTPIIITPSTPEEKEKEQAKARRRCLLTGCCGAGPEMSMDCANCRGTKHKTSVYLSFYGYSDSDIYKRRNEGEMEADYLICCLGSGALTFSKVLLYCFGDSCRNGCSPQGCSATFGRCFNWDCCTVPVGRQSAADCLCNNCYRGGNTCINISFISGICCCCGLCAASRVQ